MKRVIILYYMYEEFCEIQDELSKDKIHITYNYNASE
jgi:hypothetical protein